LTTVEKNACTVFVLLHKYCLFLIYFLKNTHSITNTIVICELKKNSTNLFDISSNEDDEDDTYIDDGVVAPLAFGVEGEDDEFFI
jgi:hypothetical protein